jgi:hypothetical protein
VVAVLNELSVPKIVASEPTCIWNCEPSGQNMLTARRPRKALEMKEKFSEDYFTWKMPNMSLAG